ncbi:universal stress protein [Streptomyces sp. 8L]|uniref:universal stress protein n=1 Tax=Streptomyces sp. 8L TaxID=2877242 RepID=UPI001CD27C16|nr:universal stress protein [Streptomyces sp. 8L]MCA1218067.1 universal stress protein [Streptomyces sp. 8L]
MSSTAFHRILIGWDGSADAHTALATALAVADGGGTVIARAVLTPSQHTETGGEHRRDVTSQRHWLTETFDEALRSNPAHRARVRLEWAEGEDVSAELRSCASEHGCDLIVVGRRGADSHLRTSGLGPVARAVCDSATVPVLLVGPS